MGVTASVCFGNQSSMAFGRTRHGGGGDLRFPLLAAPEQHVSVVQVEVLFAPRVQVGCLRNQKRALVERGGGCQHGAGMREDKVVQRHGVEHRDRLGPQQLLDEHQDLDLGRLLGPAVLEGHEQRQGRKVVLQGQNHCLKR
eukprot:2289808-Rhodomonas_salina.1